MSVKVMGFVWDLDIPSNKKFVLLAYADHANHNGESVFPSIELIAQKTGYHERSVQRLTRQLEEDGYLVDDGVGPKGQNKWKIPLSVGGDKIAPLTSGAERDDIPSGDIPSGDKMTPESPNHPEPSWDERKQKAKERKERQAKEREERGGLLGMLSKNAEHEQLLEDMYKRVEDATGLDVTGPRFEDLVVFLIKRERRFKQTIEKYAEWMENDPYNSPKKHQIAQRPDIVRETWLSAFQNEEPEFQRPEWKKYVPEEGNYVPNPNSR